MTSFYSSKRFNPLHKFPYGIGRSGEFNREQASLLELYGESYLALDCGEREPRDDEERRFIEVCQGKLEAHSKHEKVWLLYRKKLGNRVAASPFGSTSSKQDFQEDMATRRQDLDTF